MHRINCTRQRDEWKGFSSVSTQQGQGWEAIYNIPAITLTWYKPAGQDQLPWQAKHSPDVESPQHCPQGNPREGSEISLMYQFALYGDGTWSRVIPWLHPPLLWSEELNPLRGFFFILQKSLRAMLILYKRIRFVLSFFFLY